MTMAAAIGNETARAVTPSHTATVAQVEVFDSFSAAEREWRAFESAGQITSPYQRFDIVNAWQNTIGAAWGTTPCAAVAYDTDRRPLMLLPLTIRAIGPFRTAHFPGGKHSNINMALWRRDFAVSATPGDVRAILAKLAARMPRLDVLALAQQPVEWNGVRNPFSLLPHQDSINECPLLTFDPSAPPAARIAGSQRRRLNGKERKLQALPGYRYLIAGNEAELKRLLDAFFAIKPLRMAEQKIKNVFAEAGTEQFIRQACLAGLSNGKPGIEVHGLVCDNEVIAIFAGTGNGHRFSTMFNTYTMSEAARHSPGLVLIRNMIDHHAERGYSSVDFGVGTDDYKLHFCKERQPLFDSFLPLTIKGRLVASILSSTTRAKRAFKHSPTAMKLLQSYRLRFN
ncbi:protein involved in cellulose biosynthesis (CelD) [Afipia sp. P52-10]|nr:GNAT family N-acetyltransferase [Afipia sp. P52-10]ETR75360.1 protein involved in cellulose biosynthesis (CelD) [Afipia sp. P52-10]